MRDATASADGHGAAEDAGAYKIRIRTCMYVLTPPDTLVPYPPAHILVEWQAPESLMNVPVETPLQGPGMQHPARGTIRIPC